MSIVCQLIVVDDDHLLCTTGTTPVVHFWAMTTLFLFEETLYLPLIGTSNLIQFTPPPKESKNLQKHF